MLELTIDRVKRQWNLLDMSKEEERQAGKNLVTLFFSLERRIIHYQYNNRIIQVERAFKMYETIHFKVFVYIQNYNVETNTPVMKVFIP